MANPYHDSIGRFTTREGQLRNIQNAIKAKDVNAYLAERAALEEADKEAKYSPVSEKTSLVHPALSLKEEDLKEQQRILKEGTKEEVEYYIEERVNRPEFLKLLEDRDKMRDTAKKVNEEYKLLNEAWNNDLIDDYEPVREKGFESLKAYEDLQILKHEANEYKDITAPVVARLAELQREQAIADGTFREYTEDTLNDLELTGEFPSGSREWLEQRQNGIGGSDVGQIIGATPEYGARNYQEVLDSKLKPITDEQVAEQEAGHTDYTGYTGRGNAWEDVIANKYAENHPEANITYCKTSWRNKKNPYQFANFDGLMTDENGKPNGILEIKTASDGSKWGNVEDGLDAVPANYKAQVLWYAQAAGFEKGAVAVMIDDREYREYHFTMTPELKAEAKANLEKVDKFVQEVESRKNGTWEEQKRAVAKGFSQKMVKEAIKGDLKAFEDIAVYREEKPEATMKRFKQLCADTDDESEVRATLRTLFSEKNPATRKQKFVGVDIETSNTTPTSGRIIEIGMAIKHPDGSQEDVKELFGLPNRALKATGTGAVEIHGIREGMIANKKRFSNPEIQESILKKLKGGIMVAHNADYERRFFRQHLKGFAEAEKAGEIRVLDTRKLTQYLLPDTDNNSLESLTNWYGIDYSGAHRAHFDADVMIQSLVKLEEEIFVKGKKTKS